MPYFQDFLSKKTADLPSSPLFIQSINQNPNESTIKIKLLYL